MQFSLALLPLLSIGFRQVEAQGPTHLYIDQVPLYSSLRPCVQGRISAIVRAQASGCGDNTQLTSFACFCIDSSSEYASIISTAVLSDCGRDVAPTTTSDNGSVRTTTNIIGNVAGRVRAREMTATSAPTPTGAAPRRVMSALEVFDSYCAKSTELTRFQQPQTITITQSPQQTVLPASDPSPSAKPSSTIIAAVVISAILILIAAVAGILFFLHRRQKRNKQATDAVTVTTTTSSELSDDTAIREKDGDRGHRIELLGDQSRRVEMALEMKSAASVYEMYHPAVELDGSNGVEIPTGREQPSTKQGWI
ncbi:hypothetical protein K458DRAFT_388252 [Lentithecium fluviatile CBS 122367]|uniref:Extracellular membrane protein CFEM domain-containing protein n=1 Tax=Lentithecium fluviatile CBS 122367 TaxID=1168545 RepID=A0A6G1J587_9PLEO|nr:hypothetical protein K458DRAFT_388252 [Lentithecium fluviatile CBS 122367]